ncbi:MULTISPECIES: helix-turn-helix domain-containing protein [Listeria]|uniref:helix-turn-helix domain-containing protein n=1 Tax=Listeria TaxID=1637 RepID=UPI000B588572|nr:MULTISPECIES: helix-turn-helix domain-containing protein [Listeria]
MLIGLDLFDANIELEWNLLEILRKEDRWFTTEELAAKLEKTPALILKSISLLKDNLADFNNNRIQLHISKGRGVYLEIQESNIDFGLFLIYLTSNTTMYKLFYSIFTETFISTKKFAYENFLSETTVRRQITKMREAITPYHLSFTRSEVNVIGDEIQIRFFMNMAFWRLFAGKAWPFSQVDEKHLQYVVTRLLQKINLELNLVQKQQIIYFLAIGTIRRRNGHYIPFNPSWEELLTNNSGYSLFKKHISEFTPTIKLHDGEIAFLYFLMIIQSKTPQITPLLLSNYRTNHVNNSRLFRANKLFIEKFEAEFSPIPNAKKRLFTLTAFSDHLFASLTTNFSTGISGSKFLPYTQNKLVNLKNKIDYLLDTLYEESHDSIFLEKKYLAPKYALLLNLFSSLHIFEREIKVRLETDMSYIMNKSIIHELKAAFVNKFNLRFIEVESDEEADLILTNIPLERLINHHVHSKIVSIHRKLAPRDLTLINSALEKLN